MAQAIAIIQTEHRGYAALLHCLDGLVQDIEMRGTIADFELFHLMLAYIREFLDRFHHPKEDAYLFKALRKRHPASNAVVAILEKEHEQGPELIRALEVALEDYEQSGDGAFPRFRDAVREYVAFERAHVKREETDILPLARQYLTAEDWREIDAAFATNEDPLFGAEPKKRFERLFSTIVALAPAPFGLGARRMRV